MGGKKKKIKAPAVDWANTNVGDLILCKVKKDLAIGIIREKFDGTEGTHKSNCPGLEGIDVPNKCKKKMEVGVELLPPEAGGDNEYPNVKELWELWVEVRRVEAEEMDIPPAKHAITTFQIKTSSLLKTNPIDSENQQEAGVFFNPVTPGGNSYLETPKQKYHDGVVKKRRCFKGFPGRCLNLTHEGKKNAVVDILINAEAMKKIEAYKKKQALTELISQKQMKRGQWVKFAGKGPNWDPNLKGAVQSIEWLSRSNRPGEWLAICVDPTARVHEPDIKFAMQPIESNVATESRGLEVILTNRAERSLNVKGNTLVKFSKEFSFEGDHPVYKPGGTGNLGDTFKEGDMVLRVNGRSVVGFQNDQLNSFIETELAKQGSQDDEKSTYDIHATERGNAELKPEEKPREGEIRITIARPEDGSKTERPFTGVWSPENTRDLQLKGKGDKLGEKFFLTQHLDGTITGHINCRKATLGGLLIRGKVNDSGRACTLKLYWPKDSCFGEQVVAVFEAMIVDPPEDQPKAPPILELAKNKCKMGVLAAGLPGVRLVKSDFTMSPYDKALEGIQEEVTAKVETHKDSLARRVRERVALKRRAYSEEEEVTKLKLKAMTDTWNRLRKRLQKDLIMTDRERKRIQEQLGEIMAEKKRLTERLSGLLVETEEHCTSLHKQHAKDLQFEMTRTLAGDLTSEAQRQGMMKDSLRGPGEHKLSNSTRLLLEEVRVLRKQNTAFLETIRNLATELKTVREGSSLVVKKLELGGDFQEDNAQTPKEMQDSMGDSDVDEFLDFDVDKYKSKAIDTVDAALAEVGTTGGGRHGGHDNDSLDSY